VNGNSQWTDNSPSRLAWSEGWRKICTDSPFIKWTGRNIAMAKHWWQHDNVDIYITIIITSSSSSSSSLLYKLIPSYFRVFLFGLERATSWSNPYEQTCTYTVIVLPAYTVQQLFINQFTHISPTFIYIKLHCYVYQVNARLQWS